MGQSVGRLKLSWGFRVVPAIPGLKKNSRQSKRLTEKQRQKNNTTCVFTFSVPIFLPVMFAKQPIRAKQVITVTQPINRSKKVTGNFNGSACSDW